MSRYLLAIPLALLLAGCSGGASTEAPEKPGLGAEAFYGTYQMRMTEEEKRALEEANIAPAMLHVREDGTWSFNYLGEQQEGTYKVEDGALAMEVVMINEAEIPKEERVTNTMTPPDKDGKDAMLTDTANEIDLKFDRTEDPGTTPESGASEPNTEGN